MNELEVKVRITIPWELTRKKSSRWVSPPRTRGKGGFIISLKLWVILLYKVSGGAEFGSLSLTTSLGRQERLGILIYGPCICQIGGSLHAGVGIDPHAQQTQSTFRVQLDAIAAHCSARTSGLNHHWF
jgi:hypothetical protein